MVKLAKLASVVVVGAAIVVLPFVFIYAPSNESDGFRLFLGLSQDGLMREGRRLYPDESLPHNHPCHRLASRLTAEKYGVAVSLAGGVFNEVAESISLALVGGNPFGERNISETLGDFGANWRGIEDVFTGTPRR